MVLHLLRFALAWRMIGGLPGGWRLVLHLLRFVLAWRLIGGLPGGCQAGLASVEVCPCLETDWGLTWRLEAVLQGRGWSCFCLTFALA